MRSPRLWASLGLVALLGIGVWVARHTYWERVNERGLPSAEVYTDPLYIQRRVASELGALTEQGEPTQALPPRDAVILLYRWRWDENARRDTALRQWVEQGGSLVVDRSSGFSAQFEAWSGASLHYLQGDDLRAARKRAQALHDATEDLYFDGNCQQLRARALPAGMTPAPQGWQLCWGDNDSYFDVTASSDLLLEDKAGPQLVRVRVGSGTVTLLNAPAFNYYTMLHADNARLFALATQLGRGRHLYLLRGDVAAATLLQLLWARAWGAVLLLAVAAALAAWRAAVRFGPMLSPPLPARRSLRAQLAGTGQFLRHYGGAHSLWQATFKALDAAIVRHLPRSQSLDPQQRVRQVAELAQTDARLLAVFLDPAASPDARALPRALALVETVRRRLLDTSKNQRSLH